MLKRYFGCAVRFDAPVDLLVLDEAALSEPFVTHNSDLLTLMVPQLEVALQRKNERSKQWRGAERALEAAHRGYSSTNALSRAMASSHCVEI